MTKISNSIIDSIHNLEMKWHLLAGFFIGAGPLSFIANHWEEILIAPIVGFLTAMGAGLGKAWADRIAQKRKAKQNSKE